MKRERTTRHKVSHVKFTPEEMAYDPSPEETEKWTLVGRGAKAIFGKPAKGATSVTLDPDVAKVFHDSRTVNRALRKLLEAMPESSGVRKTA